jgi:hypothetical protein
MGDLEPLGLVFFSSPLPFRVLFLSLLSFCFFFLFSFFFLSFFLCFFWVSLIADRSLL